MGNTGKWFRLPFLSSKKSSSDPSAAAAEKEKKKKKKSSKSISSRSANNFKNEVSLTSAYGGCQLDANKHAIAVAAATAAVAEAALAAAHAAAQVVRLTTGSGSGRNEAAAITRERRRVLAAVKIQSIFRAYLARRALKALKGLVKLQALIRGRIVRKQSADMLRRMQVMARIQARASAQRSGLCSPNVKCCNSHHPGVVDRRNYDHLSHIAARQGGYTFKENSEIPSTWLDHRMDQQPWNNRLQDIGRSDKILEIDTWKPHHPTGASPGGQYFSAWNNEHLKIAPLPSLLAAKPQNPNPSISSEEGNYGVQSSTAVNSRSALSRPTRSECSTTVFSTFLSHPNYMANTESSRAKVRSQSVPKQRLQPMQEYAMWEPDAVSEKGFVAMGKHHNGYGYRRGADLQRQGDGGFSFSSSYGHRS